MSSAWRLSGVLKLESPIIEDFRLARASVENIWVLRQVPKDGGVGWFTSVEASTDVATTNSSQFGPIIQIEADKLSFTGNPLFAKTFGCNRVEAIALNYGWNIKYKLNDSLSVGVEGFGLIAPLGEHQPRAEQQHRFGPTLFATLKLSLASP